MKLDTVRVMISREPGIHTYSRTSRSDCAISIHIDVGNNVKRLKQTSKDLLLVFLISTGQSSDFDLKNYNTFTIHLYLIRI